MADVEHDLGPAQEFEAEAVGLPGQRTFRLRIVTAEGAASLWLEKEQVRALATAVEQILAQHRRPDSDRARPAPPPLRDFPARPTLDFHIGRLALGYDAGADLLALYATDAKAANEERPTLRATFTRHQARLFTVQVEATVAAGRPTCPLCKEPLDDDEHFCPPANGHSTDAVAWLGPLDL